MTEGELLEIIKNYLIGMKSAIDSNEYFEINTEQTKEFYFAIATIVSLKNQKIADLERKLAIETIDNKYNQEERDEETIPRYKIREKIEQIKSFDKAMHQKNGQFTILVLQGLLKEDDGDHIPRID